MKSKTMYLLLIFLLLLLIVSYSRLVEIYKPIQSKSISWKPIFDLKQLSKDYVAQGIEVYKDYLFFTVHEKDKGSVLLLFKIKKENTVEYLFSLKFPKGATHVSDLSIYKNSLYAIDYASNNLYQINIKKTLETKTLIISRTIQTNINKSGSIIVTNYKNEDIILISQFILSKDVQAYKLSDLNKKNKKSLFKIQSKYFIQGLYKKDKYIYITSNTSGIDPIFIINEKSLLSQKNLDNSTPLIIGGPGRMIEDIAVFDDYLVTSDEETNKIYISQEKIKEHRRK